MVGYAIKNKISESFRAAVRKETLVIVAAAAGLGFAEYSGRNLEYVLPQERAVQIKAAVTNQKPYSDMESEKHRLMAQVARIDARERAIQDKEAVKVDRGQEKEIKNNEIEGIGGMIVTIISVGLGFSFSRRRKREEVKESYRKVHRAHY